MGHHDLFFLYVGLCRDRTQATSEGGASTLVDREGLSCLTLMEQARPKLIKKSDRGRRRMPITFELNGRPQSVDAQADTPLLYVLTDELGLKGARFGCGLAQCGSCSVLVDGVEMRSCVLSVSKVSGRRITTLEGLAAFHAKQHNLPRAPDLHPLQQAFIDNEASQCGYCYNGMAVKGAELLSRKAAPTEAQIRQHMAGHLCRCGTYQRVLEAIQDAAKRIGADHV
jgi:aerobic-type carbon monoxide dehydrogenase small subunit (CoxS/CutS family)